MFSPTHLTAFRVTPFTSNKHKRKSAGLNCLAYPVNRGLRIAHQLRISNVEAHAEMKYNRNYRSTMYVIPLGVGHRVIVQLVFRSCEVRLTARITSNSTSFDYVCRPPKPPRNTNQHALTVSSRTSTFDNAKIQTILELTKFIFKKRTFLAFKK